METYNDILHAPITFKDSLSNKTGGWRTFKPIFDEDKCIKCYICWKFCPEACIRIREDEYPEPDYDYCKGCGICASECPKECIKMVEEVKD